VVTLAPGSPTGHCPAGGSAAAQCGATPLRTRAGLPPRPRRATFRHRATAEADRRRVTAVLAPLRRSNPRRKDVARRGLSKRAEGPRSLGVRRQEAPQGAGLIRRHPPPLFLWRSGRLGRRPRHARSGRRAVADNQWGAFLLCAICTSGGGITEPLARGPRRDSLAARDREAPASARTERVETLTDSDQH
jgi:hypothetical protein